MSTPELTIEAAPAAGRRAESTREHILDVALDLMSTHGAGTTSMRQLARACDCNVAAIYHYFPSKADLLRSVIEERQYALRLRELPEVDPSLPPRERLEALIAAMWQGSLEEEAIWRLLLGEGLRGDVTALAVGRELLDVIEPGLVIWITELFDDEVDAPVLAAIVMSQLFSFFVTHLFRDHDERDAEIRLQAARIAALGAALILAAPAAPGPAPVPWRSNPGREGARAVDPGSVRAGRC